KPEAAEALGWFPKPLRLTLAGTGFAAVFATVFMLNTQETGVTLDQQLARLDQTEIVNYLLANDRLERGDLAMLNLADADLTAEFITADQSDIRQALEDEPLEDLYL
ncbi:MAG TPA: hypothetical protein VK927_07690, partial [Adhaeribacter sp.]|nr:hypothetical protein [Adhaeribacter sp.]